MAVGFCVGAACATGIVLAVVRYLDEGIASMLAQQRRIIGRLRGDTHSLATWLILARERIREAEKLIDRWQSTAPRSIRWCDAYDGDDWKKRVRETVWEVKKADIDARDFGHWDDTA
jgi:hypothetical protein